MSYFLFFIKNIPSHFNWIVVSTFFLCGMNIGITQGRDVLELWPHAVPDQDLPRNSAVVNEMAKKGTEKHITKVTNPTLTVFKPNPSKNNGAAIIISPGGGYWILAIDKEGYEIADWLCSLGYTAFVLQYRVPNNRRGALQDLQRAIKMVRGRADYYGIEKNKIGVLGFSAGGSLSARASTAYHKNSYPVQDDYDKENSRPDFALLLYAAYLNEGKNGSLTEELAVNSHTPPMFLFATADDQHVQSSLVMASELNKKDVPVELHILPEGGHGYGMRKGNVAAETWPMLAEKWLDQIHKVD